jgi:F-type H+-transporting ATPase subunit b
LEGLGINLGYFLVQVFSFLIVFVLLRALAYRPILEMLERRRKTVAQGLEDARVAAEARAGAEKDAQAHLAKAQHEANELLRKAAEQSEQAARQMRAAAEKEAADIRSAALAEADQAKQHALGELREQVAALAIAAAEKLIRESLDERRQRALIAEFFSGIKGGKVQVLEQAPLAGTSAEVSSALPLTAEEQEIIRREIVGRLGSGSTITFRVDPSLLGGLVVSVGDKVLDGSVLGGLEGLRQSLK